MQLTTVVVGVVSLLATIGALYVGLSRLASSYLGLRMIVVPLIAAVVSSLMARVFQQSRQRQAASLPPATADGVDKKTS